MRKADVENIKDLELYYSKARKIKFENNIEIKSIKDIKYNLFDKERKTTYTRGGHHCNKGRSRSFDDFFLLSKFYFPEKKLKEIVSLFIKDEKEKLENEEPCITYRYCPNIRKSNSGGLFRCGYSILVKKLDSKLCFGFPNFSFSFNDIKNS